MMGRANAAAATRTTCSEQHSAGIGEQEPRELPSDSGNRSRSDVRSTCISLIRLLLSIERTNELDRAAELRDPRAG